ncbi:MAG TPA: CHASE4 domain-containing protein, partial [Anaerolineae bacterium]
MTLRWKTASAIALAFLSLLALLLVAAAILLDSFAALETRQTTTDAERARDSLSNSLTELTSKSGDWANWDDAYTFVENGNPAFVQSNLTDDTFVQLNLDLVAFVDASGRVVFSKAFDDDSRQKLPFPPSLLAHFKPNDLLISPGDIKTVLSGVKLLPEGALMVVARPILTSDGKGPSRGTLIFGRYVDATVINQWSATAHLSLSVRRYDDPALPPDFKNAAGVLSQSAPIFVHPLSDQAIAGYSRIEDMQGGPALVIRVDSPREIYQQGQTTTRRLLVSLLIICISFGGVGLVGLDRLVLSPIVRLSREVDRVGAHNDLSARVDVRGNDELASLGRTINGMLQSLEHSHTDINGLKDAQGELRDNIAAMQTLAKIEQIITSRTSLADWMDLLLKETLKEMRGDIATIYLLDRARYAVKAFAQQGARRADLWPGLRFGLGEGAAGWVVQHAQPLAMVAVSEDPRWLAIDSFESEGVVSYLAVPMRVDGRVIG